LLHDLRGTVLLHGLPSFLLISLNDPMPDNTPNTRPHKSMISLRTPPLGSYDLNHHSL
jgi:hypothetical protein